MATDEERRADRADEVREESWHNTHHDDEHRDARCGICCAAARTEAEEAQGAVEQDYHLVNHETETQCWVRVTTVVVDWEDEAHFSVTYGVRPLDEWVTVDDSLTVPADAATGVTVVIDGLRPDGYRGARWAEVWG